MKKLFILVMMLCFSTPFASSADAKLGIYIAPKLVSGFASFDAHLDSLGNRLDSSSLDDELIGGALAVGYDFSHLLNLNLRAELEFTMFGDFEDRSNPGKYNLNGDVSLSVLFLNLYYDFENKTKFTPYVSAGAGIAFVGMEGTAKDTVTTLLDKNTQGNFAWNVGTGLAFDLTDGISFDLGYRYAQYGDGESEVSKLHDLVSLSAKNIDMHQIALGVRLTF